MSDALLSALTDNHSYSPWWPHAPYWFCMAEEKRAPAISEIITATIKFYDVDRASFMKAKRYRAAVARQVSMYLAYKLTEHTHPAIGRVYRNCDHTSSVRAFQTVSTRIERDPQFAADVARLEAIFA